MCYLYVYLFWYFYMFCTFVISFSKSHKHCCIYQIVVSRYWWGVGQCYVFTFFASRPSAAEGFQTIILNPVTEQHARELKQAIARDTRIKVEAVSCTN